MKVYDPKKYTIIDGKLTIFELKYDLNKRSVKTYDHLMKIVYVRPQDRIFSFLHIENKNFKGSFLTKDRLFQQMRVNLHSEIPRQDL